MKRLSLLVVALGVLVSGCGSSSTSPTTPTNPTFTATLLPANEVPAIQGAEATGSGTATVTIVTTKDSAGNVTAATATFVVNLSGFPANTPINIAHIHAAASGVNGAVVINSGLTAGQTVLANGSGTFTAANLTITPVDLANQILANPAGFYFNVHSTLNPGGVARGQLVRQQ
jgi:CHRD domain-containing protein